MGLVQLCVREILSLKPFYGKLSPTVFLASKVEEFGVISNSRLISTCQSVIKNKYSMPFKNSEFPYRIQNVLECEFHLLETMDCCLILYHPYRPLLQVTF